MKGAIRRALLALLLTTTGLAQAQGVYVAGQGFSLEQALEQALAEQRGGTPFWIVADGVEARRVADSSAADLVRRAGEHGGSVLVCETALSTITRTGAGLPPGVALVRAAPESAVPLLQAEEEQRLPAATRQNRLIQRTCAPR